MPVRFSVVAGAAVMAATAALAAPERPPLAAYAEADQAALVETYAARRAAAAGAYDARTAQRTEEGGPRFVNRMILEASPYLRQHAHNPVDWRPWGPAALAEAKATNRPIFLSVGYATCHWCHVMADESFDALDVAEQLNRDFIPIKVDREALPGVDETYMLATALMTGSGGWPNSVWLTPEGAPFYAGTYFPKAQFEQLLHAVASAWREEPEAARQAATQLSGAMRAYQTRRAAAAAIDETVYAAALADLAGRHNALQGGFSQTAQFPFEVYMQFLLDEWRRTGSEQALAIATETLDAILAGGVHDHVGGGFHRYAVDPAWDVPHFEKMLYNQAEISRALIAAWEATGAPRYRRAAERALDYVLRDMRAPSGAFYAAEDAVSLVESGAKEEGAFYVWNPEELDAALAPMAADPAAAKARETMEFVNGAALPGAVMRVSTEALESLPALDPAFEALRAAREARPRPLKDEKILAGWNGMMIRALAEAAAAFDRPDYAEAARVAGEALWADLWVEGAMLRFSVAGEGEGAESPAPPAALQDYAWVGLGYLALHELDGAATPLERARLLAETLLERFSDGAGRLKITQEDGPLGPIYAHDDGSTPSGESSALELLSLLARRETGLESRGRAEALLAALSGDMAQHPGDRTIGLLASRILSEGESAPRRALSGGVLRASARREGETVRIALAIAEGWHLNGAQPLQDFLIPTKLEGPDLGPVAYPPAKEKTLGFSETPLRVLEGVVEIAAPLAVDGPGAVSLTVQACSDEVCLAPETAQFRLARP